MGRLGEGRRQGSAGMLLSADPSHLSSPNTRDPRWLLGRPQSTRAPARSRGSDPLMPRPRSWPHLSAHEPSSLWKVRGVGWADSGVNRPIYCYLHLLGNQGLHLFSMNSQI